jgi:hypothetical protein
MLCIEAGQFLRTLALEAGAAVGEQAGGDGGRHGDGTGVGWRIMPGRRRADECVTVSRETLRRAD